MLQRLEFHYTPKHDTWLNMVEIRNRRACASSVWIARSVRVSSLSSRSRRGSGNATLYGARQMEVHHAKGAGQTRAYPDTAKESQSLCRGMLGVLSGARFAFSLLNQKGRYPHEAIS